MTRSPSQCWPCCLGSGAWRSLNCWSRWMGARPTLSCNRDSRRAWGKVCSRQPRPLGHGSSPGVQAPASRSTWGMLSSRRRAQGSRVSRKRDLRWTKCWPSSRTPELMRSLVCSVQCRQRQVQNQVLKGDCALPRSSVTLLCHRGNENMSVWASAETSKSVGLLCQQD